MSLVKIFSSLVNGGYIVKPSITFNERPYKERVLKKETSDKINNLLYQIVDLGTGKRAKIEGLKIGGKTGTARKSKDKEGYYDDKIITSFIGVFPVAMSTIIVSPTARPKPIITAENMPGLADNKTTLTNVCQGVAPKANDPEVKCLGTLNIASSAIEKIVGMTAKPIAIPIINALR